MVWYFIGVHIIYRTLHDRLEIWNFFSCWKNISLVRCAHSWNISQHSKSSEIYKQRWWSTKPFAVKGVIYYVSDSNGDLFMCEDHMLFPLVKISCFCPRAHLVFHLCLYKTLSSFFLQHVGLNHPRTREILSALIPLLRTAVVCKYSQLFILFLNEQVHSSACAH